MSLFDSYSLWDMFFIVVVLVGVLWVLAFGINIVYDWVEKLSRRNKNG